MDEELRGLVGQISEDPGAELCASVLVQAKTALERFSARHQDALDALEVVGDAIRAYAWIDRQRGGLTLCEVCGVLNLDEGYVARLLHETLGQDAREYLDACLQRNCPLCRQPVEWGEGP